MTFPLLGLFWVAFGTAVGYLTTATVSPDKEHLILGAIGGGLLGIIVNLIERALGRYPIRSLVGGCLGLLAGLWVGRLLFGALPTHFFASPGDSIVLLGVMVFCGTLGAALGFRKGHEISNRMFPWVRRETNSGEKYLLLDTSVIIDGRIADICETGFLQGILAIPQFILKELQQIADSSDSLKRARGRRGLDILKKIQDQKGNEVRIMDRDFPRIRDVDGKLVEFAKNLEAPILTNDFNLNKVAELQGIQVLNINQLANALKPIVLPGEVMRVRIVKEGKEHGQGVAYLDDGTMVVVDSAKKYMGKSIDVAVTSVLQTTAGRMIFTMVKDGADSQAQFGRG